MKDPNQYVPGWNLERVRRVIQHYESQTDEEAVAEDEAASKEPRLIMTGLRAVLVPTPLLGRSVLGLTREEVPRLQCGFPASARISPPNPSAPPLQMVAPRRIPASSPTDH